MKNKVLQFLLYVLFTGTTSLKAQEPKTKIYLIHGQGSDPRLFSKLKLNSEFDTVCLRLPMPHKNESMQEYAYRLIPEIDTTAPFILIGVSLGGMVATELNDRLNPLQTIIISSAKNRKELPKRYRFMRAIPVYKIFPARFVKWGSFIMQPLVEPDRKKEKALFKSMLKQKDKLFLKRSIPMIMNWAKKENTGKIIIHIHGNNDHTIPVKNIHATKIIEGGSHMMVLTQATILSQTINEILAKIN